MKEKLKIKTGDLVRVIAGDHKGYEGEVISVDRIKNKAIVKEVNMVSRHQKPGANNPQGKTIKKEAPIHISNLSLLTASGENTRVKYEIRDGKKVRLAKKSNEVI